MWVIGKNRGRSRKTTFFMIIFILLIISFVEANNNTENSRNYYNIIFISIDTLRFDHLGCYGYSRDTSPNIDVLAKDSILFEQAISQSGATLSSHTSLFTSQYLFVHGANTINTISPLNGRGVTLAEIFKINGYKTAAFTGGGHLKKIYGVNKGFDVYYDEGDWNSNLGSFNNTVPRAINWLKENKNNKSFLFLHGYDVHVPYHSAYEDIFDPDYKGIVDRMDLSWEGLIRVYKNIYIKDNNELINLSPRDIQHIIAHYDGGIRCADEKIGEFLSEIKKMGLFDNSIIILLSDHGEDLFEHGHVGKHRSPYDEIIRVPLIIRHPGIKGPIRIKTQAQLIDVMPTILDFLGIPKNKEAQGNSLLPLIEGTAPVDFNEYVYSEYGNGVVRSKKWKLIDRFALYDLEKDPFEQYNVINKYPGIGLKYMQKLFEFTKKNDILKMGIINKILSNPGSDKDAIKINGYWN